MEKYTREVLEPLVKKHISVANILRELGVHLNGGSHSHVSRIIKRLGLDTSHFVYRNLSQRFKQNTPMREALQKAVISNLSIAGVIQELGFENKSTGRWHREISKLIKEYGIDTSHFKGRSWNKGGKMSVGHGNKKDPRIILSLRDESQNRVAGNRLKDALLEIGRPYICEYCNQGPAWNGQPLVLEVDHKNGKFWDNREENLAITCPNCHSQLPTFGIRNINHQVSIAGRMGIQVALIKPPPSVQL